jgi:hypothetical protein
MKKIIIGICLLAATTVTFANNIYTPEKNVPMSVRETFHKNYPDANQVHWTYMDGKWNANFHKTDGNMKMAACYDMKGRHIDSRMPVAQVAVPDKVIHRLNEKYPGEYTHHYTRIERPHKRDLYQVKVREQGMYKTLYIDRRGHERDYASR